MDKRQPGCVVGHGHSEAAEIRLRERFRNAVVGAIQLSEDLEKMIQRHVAEGRAATEAEFVAQAVQLYADALEADEAEMIAAADEGISDIEAGRFELIADADDMRRLRAELSAMLDQLEQQS